jgi:hypothetical protein
MENCKRVPCACDRKLAQSNSRSVVASMAMRLTEGRPSLSRLATVVACAIAAFAISCSPSALPGTPLGTYNVTGTLETNSCGTGLGPASPWTFTVQMSEDGTTLYWEMSGGSELSSTMSSATQVNITSIETANVDATEAGVEGPCDLQSNTAIDLMLAAGSAPSTFTGTFTYTFAVATGVSSTVDCTDQLSASGGPYDTLPCTVSYSLAGTHQ